MVKKIKIMTWPISNEEHDTQEKNSGYFERFSNGVIYKVVGRLQYNVFGELAFLYIKEILEDEVWGELVLDKSEGVF